MYGGCGECGGAEGAGAVKRKIFGIHAARALLPVPEGSPEQAGEPLKRWPSHGPLRAKALLSMLLDHRVAEEKAAALEGFAEDVELASRHWCDGRAPGRVETAERGRHLCGQAKQPREAARSLLSARRVPGVTISPYLARSPLCMALSAANRSAGESK